MRITVPIVCMVEDADYDAIERTNAVLESMNLPLKELPEQKTEIREGELNVDHVTLSYPSNDGTKTIVECLNSSYSVALTHKEFKLLMSKADY